MNYRVKIDRPAVKKLKKFPQKDVVKILSGMVILEKSPRAFGKKIKKLVGIKDGYRLRIGNYRILYLVLDKKARVEIYDIDLRSRVY